MQLPKNLRPRATRVKVGRKLEEICRRLIHDGIPLLDPIEDMKIQDKNGIF